MTSYSLKLIAIHAQQISVKLPKTVPLTLALIASFAALPTWAQDAPGIIGKNGWLYYRNEISSAADQPGVNMTVDLLGRVNKLLQRNGVQLVVAMAPLKIRIHPENLPASVPLDDHLKTNYDRILKNLRDRGIYAADLNTSFLDSPKRISPMPMFFRQDTHWSSSGALLAAETIAQFITADLALKPLLDTLPSVAYTLAWSPKDWPVAGDLPQQLAKGSPAYEKELIKIFTVEKSGGAATNLLGPTPPVGVTLLGSSYTADWTNFPIAMRYALQRDVLSISVNALQGQWVGLHTYLRDDAYQTNKPKLLIWEMPERDMRAPPDMKYREAQYVMDNTEWLLQTAALIQDSCTPTATRLSIDVKGLRNKQNSADKATATSTDPDEFVELNLDKPLDRLDYLSARLTTVGSVAVTLEGSGTSTKARKFSVTVAGDDAAHNLRIPLIATGGSRGFTKVRLYPGKTNGFALHDVQVCRQPDDLLKP